jgi:hypothetical protein
MVDLAEIQAAYYMVAATGVLVAAGYYVLNLRISQRNMRVNQETRQIQILMDYNRDINEGFNSMKNWVDSRNAKWSSFDEYQSKYGPVNDPEGHGYRLKTWRRLHTMGLMVKDGLISLDLFMDYIGDSPAGYWDQYSDLIKEYRVRFHAPNYLYGLEYLAGEINKYRINKGWGEKIPDDISYSPNKVSM